MKVYAFEQPPSIFSNLGMQRANATAFRGADGLIYVGSGKAGIALILAYLKLKGVLPNKMAPILVPQWLGTWVYAQMLNYGLPTTEVGSNASVVMCYHQYGFPQNMDRVLDIARDRNSVLIEDCAHAAGSLYKGQALGTIGDFGIFSFSKFAFCYALGAVTGKDQAFAGFVCERQNKASRGLRLFVNLVKFADEFNMGLQKPKAVAMFDSLRSMAYSRYGDQPLAGPNALALWLRKRDDELAVRAENFRELRSRVGHLGVCDHLETAGVSPYAVPLAVNGSKLPRLIIELHNRGIRAGTYQFDFARCVFEPKFGPVVLVPIHSGMKGGGLDLLADAILKTL